MARTNVPPTILEGDLIKKNPCYMQPKNFQTLARRNILYFFACYYYMGYCCLPAKRDYWKQRQQNSCLSSHWMDVVFSRDKFEYVWRNISMDSSLLYEEFDNTVGEGGDGEFKCGQEQVEEVIKVKTVEEEETRKKTDADNKVVE